MKAYLLVILLLGALGGIGVAAYIAAQPAQAQGCTGPNC
jgi:hypothetical protein